jgi:RNA-dependent RNA polymerase
MIADRSNIFDPDCLTLSELHSVAVDFQKTGQSVPTSKIPKLTFWQKPDWYAPETVELNSTPNYYLSKKAIGKLFRAIVLPTVPVQRHVDGDDYDNEEHQTTIALKSCVYLTIRTLVSQHISPVEKEAKDIPHMFERYASGLYNVCTMHTLSYSTTAMLTEEEAVMGTIMAKTSQPRRRTDMMSKLRESTDSLVRGVRDQLLADESAAEEQYLNRAWFAWNLSIERGNYFGAASFHWIALGAIFEALKAIKERKGAPFVL